MIAASNVRLLEIHKMSLDAIPSGGDVMSGVAFLQDAKRFAVSAKAAKAWVSEAITLVRQAAGPNPWRDATDEEIAGEILRRVKERKAKVTP